MTKNKQTFLDLPGEIRNEIYKLALVQKKPIPINQQYGKAVKLNMALFRTCKVVHEEASPLFYSLNQLDCADVSEAKIASFLARIGHRNASYISHMILDFPEFDVHWPPDETEGVSVELFRRSMQLFASIRELSPRLTMVTLRLQDAEYTLKYLECALRADMSDREEIVRQVFPLVDAQFRNISSLKTIVLEVRENEELCDYEYGAIANHGWTLHRFTEVEIININ